MDKTIPEVCLFITFGALVDCLGLSFFTLCLAIQKSEAA